MNSATPECEVVEDQALETLSRVLVLAWHPKMLEVRGDSAKKLVHLLGDSLKKAALATASERAPVKPRFDFLTQFVNVAFTFGEQGQNHGSEPFDFSTSLLPIVFPFPSTRRG